MTSSRPLALAIGAALAGACSGQEQLGSAGVAGGLRGQRAEPATPRNLQAMGPPPTALAYDGLAWPTRTVPGAGPFSMFAIGDWGGMDGAFEPGEDRPRVIAYPGGHTPGPHVFPRTRWNRAHTVELCTHTEFTECFETAGATCKATCGWRDGVDTQPQALVAQAFNARAASANPVLVLNVGDNFYWGGIEKTCGTPMGELSDAARHQFSSIFESMYAGNAPWISALGNHDYGGRRFDNGWDQQIAYTWKSQRWVMPASYYMHTVQFPDAGFSMDIFVLDSNKEDAKEPGQDPEHNICSAMYNPPGAGCAAAGGPASVGACVSWFHGRWSTQQAWLEAKLAASDADWQVVVTHFPCGTDGAWYTGLHAELGLDLLVTGHRHDQELWPASRMGGLTCFVTGGGGGITSEADPSDTSEWYGEAQYGFFDLTVSKAEILVQSINYDGALLKSAPVVPKARR